MKSCWPPSMPRHSTSVMAGAPLFRINGLGTVWVNAEVPEGVSQEVTA